MKLITEMTCAVIVAAVATLAGTFLAESPKAMAQDQPQSEVQVVESPADQPTPAPEATTEVTYNYVAQAGDSYSLMARKAVQTYGAKNQVQLSLAQIMYAETMMTQEAGSPLLNEGQQVSVKESIVKQWVEKAKALSAEEQAAWEPYTHFADFNTNHVGQAS